MIFPSQFVVYKNSQIFDNLSCIDERATGTNAELIVSGPGPRGLGPSNRHACPPHLTILLF